MYTYEGTIEKQEDGWFVAVPAFPGAFAGGATVGDACKEAAEALRLNIAEHLDAGTPLPPQEIGDTPQLVLCVDVTDEYVAETKCMTQAEAARELGVTTGRVAQLLSAGLLEPYQHGSRQLVTIASVNARKEHTPRRGRPRKKQAPVGYRYAEDGMLEPDPETAPRVKAAIERIAESYGAEQAFKEGPKADNG